MMGTLRSLASDDIPEVVSLRLKYIKYSAQGPEQDKQNYFQCVFFENPRQNDNISSLACEAITNSVCDRAAHGGKKSLSCTISHWFV